MHNQLRVSLCCQTFSNLIAAVGFDGISVLAYLSGDFRYFVLQARSIPTSEEFKLTLVPKEVELPQPFHVVMQIGIQFCPFCGIDLDQLVTNGIEVFEDLAKKHRQYVMPSTLVD